MGVWSPLRQTQAPVGQRVHLATLREPRSWAQGGRCRIGGWMAGGALVHDQSPQTLLPSPRRFSPAPTYSQRKTTAETKALLAQSRWTLSHDCSAAPTGCEGTEGPARACPAGVTSPALCLVVTCGSRIRGLLGSVLMINLCLP